MTDRTCSIETSGTSAGGPGFDFSATARTGRKARQGRRDAADFVAQLPQAEPHFCPKRHPTTSSGAARLARATASAAARAPSSASTMSSTPGLVQPRGRPCRSTPRSARRSRHIGRRRRRGSPGRAIDPTARRLRAQSRSTGPMMRLAARFAPGPLRPIPDRRHGCRRPRPPPPLSSASAHRRRQLGLVAGRVWVDDCPGRSSTRSCAIPFDGCEPSIRRVNAHCG